MPYVIPENSILAQFVECRTFHKFYKHQFAFRTSSKWRIQRDLWEDMMKTSCTALEIVKPEAYGEMSIILENMRAVISKYPQYIQILQTPGGVKTLYRQL